MQWFKVPAKIYFERDSIQYLQDMKDCEKVMIVTDRSMVDLGFVDKITYQLHQRKNKVTIQLFTDVEADPSVQTVYKRHGLMRSFPARHHHRAGRRSPMDAAKAMWLFYEQPQVDFEDLVQNSWTSVNARSASLNWAEKPNSSAFLPHRVPAPK